MTDQDPIDHRLRALVRDLAEEVELAGPRDARQRGERRRARQRVAGTAVAVVAISVLVAGAWQLAPWSPTDQRGTPAASFDEGRTGQDLGEGFGGVEDAPLPPDALLWDDTLGWRFAEPTTRAADRLGNPVLFCGLPSAPASALPASQSARYYQGADDSVARYELLEFATPEQAARAEDELWRSSVANPSVPDSADGPEGSRGEGAGSSGETEETAAANPWTRCETWWQDMDSTVTGHRERHEGEMRIQESWPGWEVLRSRVWTWQYVARHDTKVAVLRVIVSRDLVLSPQSSWQDAERAGSPYQQPVICIGELLRASGTAQDGGACASAAAGIDDLPGPEVDGGTGTSTSTTDATLGGPTAGDSGGP